MRGVAALLLLGSASCGPPRPPMTDGERTYRAKCSACHRLFEPGEGTPEQWQDAVAKMERLRKVWLDQAQEDLILSYLAGAPKVAPDAAASSPASVSVPASPAR